MWAGAVFWTAVAVAFLVLAWSAYRARQNLPEKTHPLATEPSMAQQYVPPAVARALKSVFTAELIGFAVAAAAAVWSVAF